MSRCISATLALACFLAGTLWAIHAFASTNVGSGSSSIPCNSYFEANVAYNYTSKTVEYCNGTIWSNLLGTSSGITLGTSTTATSPQVSGDPTTGLFSAATSTVSIATGGVERLRVDSGGQVTITAGTNGSNQALTLTSPAPWGTQFNITNSQAGSNWQFVAGASGSGVINGGLGISLTSSLPWPVVQIMSNGYIGLGGSSNNIAPVDPVSMNVGPVASATHALLNLSNSALSGASSSGTYIGANPSSAGADFINYQVNGSSQLLVNKNGNVSIGTPTPDAPLTIGVKPTGTYNTSSGAITNFYAPSDNAEAVNVSRGGVVNPQQLYFGVNEATPYSEIQAGESGVAYNNLILNRQGGNIGVGIPNPNALLSLGTPITTIKLALYDGGGTSMFGVGVNADELTFGANIAVNGTPQMVLNSSGNVGIGTTAPGQLLDVDAGALLVNAGTGASTFNDLDIGGINGWAGGEAHRINFVYGSRVNPTNFSTIESAFDGTKASMNFRNFYNSGNQTSTLMTIQGNGNVGIGTAVPGALLEIYSSGAGVLLQLAGSSGTCNHTPGSSSETVSCSSDARLKDGVMDTPSALPWLSSIRVRNYTWNKTGEKRTGVIAQELQKTHPEMVIYDKKKDQWTVEQPNPWTLVKILQEQQAEIDDLKKQLASKH